MKCDYLIIGQGLAGSILAYKLIKSGKTCLVIDRTTQASSSAVAGGMFNPVTGKHLAKTWLADDIFPVLHKFYAEVSKDLVQDFYHPVSVYRPFVNENQKKQFAQAIGKHKLENYTSFLDTPAYDPNQIKNEFGGIRISDSGWLDVPAFVESIRKFLKNTGSFRDDLFDYELIAHKKGQIIYGEYIFAKIIFCEGYYAFQNPLWKWLPFNPVKGESLLCEIENYDIQEIINQGAWIIPIEQNLYRIGATYSWHELDFLKTERAKKELLEKVSVFLKCNFSVKNQQAGIRPASKDRRPFLGVHPVFKNLYIFNGLGAKGVSMAPYLADQLIDFLENKKDLDKETTIERFYPLY